jgi:hypothetical protein
MRGDLNEVGEVDGSEEGDEAGGIECNEVLLGGQSEGAGGEEEGRDDVKDACKGGVVSEEDEGEEGESAPFLAKMSPVVTVVPFTDASVASFPPATSRVPFRRVVTAKKRVSFAKGRRRT